VDELTRLALQARDGDRVAFAGFVRRTQADVWRVCAHLVDHQSADDITQETYLRAVKAIARYRGDAPAKLWLLSIARRACADTIRSRTRRRRLVERAAPAAEPSSSGGVDESVALDAIVAGLEPNRRTAFVLTQVVGLSYEDAAAVAGCPVGTIRSRVARARADLLTALARAESDTGG
jgi:RNA polymerase sigma-70 factor (ECF subfamily)